MKNNKQTTNKKKKPNNSYPMYSYNRMIKQIKAN